MYQRFTPQGRPIARTPESVEEPATTEEPLVKSDNLLLAEQLAEELLQSMKASHIFSATGVTPSTLRNLAAGKASRVSKKVLFALQRLMNQLRDPAPAPAPAPLPIPESLPAATAVDPPPAAVDSGTPPVLPDLSTLSELGFPELDLLPVSEFIDSDRVLEEIAADEARLAQLVRFRDLAAALYT